MQVPRCNTNVHHVFALRSRASFPCMRGATEGESCALLAVRRHDPVDPGILLLHLTHEVMVIQRLAGHPDDKILWIVQGAVLVNPGPLPFTQHVKATCRDLSVEIRDLLPGRGKELRGVEIPEHVRREVSKQTTRPMDVLEDAVRVIGNLNAKILFYLGIPEAREVGHFHFPVDQSFLDLETEHHVQIVRDLVRLGSYKRWFGDVDCPIEVLNRDALKLCKAALKAWIVVLPECLRTTDKVLPGSGL